MIRLRTMSWRGRRVCGSFKLLLARNEVEADLKDDCIRTPLWWAVFRRRKAVVRLLLAHNGVEVDPKGRCGRTALWWRRLGGARR